MALALYKIACPQCRNRGEDNSGDNMQVYQEEDGRKRGYCFKCSHNIYDMDSDGPKEPQQITLPYGTMKDRQVTVGVAEFFGVKRSFDVDGNVNEVYYPYGSSYKIRTVPKDFRVQGGLPPVLFGQDKFPEGGKKLVITEGEEDALAVAQSNMTHYNRHFPVVSLASATNTKAIDSNIKWIKSFDEVILWMDKDPAGEMCKQQLAKKIGYARCKIAESPEKDASDTLN